MRILTFNWHESYLHMLAGIGGRWDAVLRTKGGRSDWWGEVRPIPPNLETIDGATAATRLAAGRYDVAVCHNTVDLQAVSSSAVPAVLVFHTSRHLEAQFGFDDARWQRQLPAIRRRATFVFVSEMKRQSWDEPGRVILPGIDLQCYDGYTGETARALHVGNLKRELAAVSGIAALERMTAGLPLTLLGLNPQIPGSRLSAGWDELRGAMRTHRLYVNTTLAPYEDGYNLAMLEAMATGMPVVSTANPSSPIENGVSGFADGDVGRLRERVLELLEDRAAAHALGEAARATVRERFPWRRFKEQWLEVFDSARQQSGRNGASAHEHTHP